MNNEKAVTELAKLQSRFDIGDPKRRAIIRGMSAIKKTTWISVKDKLPEKGSDVLVKVDKPYLAVSVARYWNATGRWLSASKDVITGDEVTHWVNLPEGTEAI